MINQANNTLLNLSPNVFKWILLGLLVATNMDCRSQSRLFISAGVTRSSGGPLNLLKDYSQALAYPYFDLEIEKKLVGSFYLVTGLSYLSTGYSSDDKFFGSAIEFRASYIALPLLARWNYRNRNSLLLDMGLHPYFLLNANLTERINQFNSEKVVEGNITEYSTRIFLGVKFQGTIAFGRLLLSAFWMVPFQGQTVTRNLDQHWGLNKEQSTYLLNNDYLPLLFGAKAGFRIK
jgi:hypothetical protein